MKIISAVAFIILATIISLSYFSPFVSKVQAASLVLTRYYNPTTTDHWTSSPKQLTSVPAGYNQEGNQGYIFDSDDGTGLLEPLYDCARTVNGKLDHLNTNSSSGCTSYTQPGVLLGYIYKAPPIAPSSRVFRCYNANSPIGNHVTEKEPNDCPVGYTTEGTLGYSLNSGVTPTPTPITVSGKLYDKTTSQPVGAGQKISTCGADSSRDPTVDNNGSFNFQLQIGDLFCIKGSPISGYSGTEAVHRISTSIITNHYEWQVVGIDCAVNPNDPVCQGSGGGTSSVKEDRSSDSGYDLAYTPLPPTAPVLTKIEISENQLFPSGQTTVLTPPFTLDSGSLIYTQYQFADSSAGIKSIWVRYTSDQGSVQTIGPVSIELVKDDNGAGTTYPHISTLTCSRDTSTNNVNFSIAGDYFGQTVGTLTRDSAPLTVVGNWTQTLVSATYKNAPADQNSFNITLTRFDGKSTSSTCNLSSSQVSIGADYFCPAIPNHTESNVNLTLYDSSASSTQSAQLLETQVTIDSLGIIQGLNYNFVEGKTYTLSIKTAASLLKFGTFEARTSAGTTTVLNITLPVGDIHPIPGDGVINTFDQSTLETQWGTPPPLTPNGDFNLDAKINSFDWACMRYNFGEINDPTPSFPI